MDLGTCTLSCSHHSNEFTHYSQLNIPFMILVNPLSIKGVDSSYYRFAYSFIPQKIKYSIFYYVSVFTQKVLESLCCILHSVAPFSLLHTILWQVFLHPPPPLLLGPDLTVTNQSAMNFLVIFCLCQSLILSMLNINRSSVLGKESNYRNIEQEAASLIVSSDIGVYQNNVCLVHVCPWFRPQHQTKPRRQSMGGGWLTQHFVHIPFLIV